MAEKTIPVYITRGSDKVQIGVAGEVDPETNSQAIDIWDEFKDQKISNLTIGDADVPPLRAEEPAPKTREEFRSSNKQEAKS